MHLEVSVLSEFVRYRKKCFFLRIDDIEKSVVYSYDYD